MSVTVTYFLYCALFWARLKKCGAGVIVYRGGLVAEHANYDPANYAKALQDNERMRLVWEASGALYPTIYMSSSSSVADDAAVSLY